MCVNMCSPLCICLGVLGSLQEMGTKWDRMILNKYVGNLYTSEHQLCRKLEVKIHWCFPFLKLENKTDSYTGIQFEMDTYICFCYTQQNLVFEWKVYAIFTKEIWNNCFLFWHLWILPHSFNSFKGKTVLWKNCLAEL